MFAKTLRIVLSIAAVITVSTAIVRCSPISPSVNKDLLGREQHSTSNVTIQISPNQSTSMGLSFSSVCDLDEQVVVSSNCFSTKVTDLEQYSDSILELNDSAPEFKRHFLNFQKWGRMTLDRDDLPPSPRKVFIKTRSCSGLEQIDPREIRLVQTEQSDNTLLIAFDQSTDDSKESVSKILPCIQSVTFVSDPRSGNVLQPGN